MRTKVRWGGEEKSAVFRSAGAPLDGGEPSGQDFAVEYVMLSPEQWRLDIGGERANVHVVRTADGTWVWHEGRARLVRGDEALAARRGKRDHGPGIVTPPMPATVVRILVELGQKVEAKAPLIIVSAMKMETTLRAPYAGIVSGIHVQAGASVKPGEILVDVAPEA